jgi:hypothetical protein
MNPNLTVRPQRRWGHCPLFRWIRQPIVRIRWCIRSIGDANSARAA